MKKNISKIGLILLILGFCMIGTGAVLFVTSSEKYEENTESDTNIASSVPLIDSTIKLTEQNSNTMTIEISITNNRDEDIKAPEVTVILPKVVADNFKISSESRENAMCGYIYIGVPTFSCSWIDYDDITLGEGVTMQGGDKLGLIEKGSTINVAYTITIDEEHANNMLDKKLFVAESIKIDFKKLGEKDSIINFSKNDIPSIMINKSDDNIMTLVESK